MATTVCWPYYNKIYTLNMGQPIQWFLFPPVVIMCYSKMKFSTWSHEWPHIQDPHRLRPPGNFTSGLTDYKKSLRFSLKMQPEDIVPPKEREAKVKINFLYSYVIRSAENCEMGAFLCFLKVLLVNHTTLWLCDVSNLFWAILLSTKF